MTMDKPIYLTEQGFEKLRTELTHLRDERKPVLVRRLHNVQGGSDWMEDTEFISSVREELNYLDNRIQELEYMLEYGKLLEPAEATGQVVLGSTVEIQEVDEEEAPLETYTIVNAAEADPADGLISDESPLGEALLSHEVGDTVEVKTPDGKVRFRVLAIR